MSAGGLLQSVKSLVGSFVALIREDGTTELCEVVAPATPPVRPPAVILTSNLVSDWVVNTPLAVDDTYTPLSQFIVGINERNPFLVASVEPTLSQGNGADASLFSSGGADHTLYLQVEMAFEITFSSGVGQCIFTANLFDDLGVQLTNDGGIFTSPTTQLVKRVLTLPALALAANRRVLLQMKKNDQNATVISGCNLLGLSLALANAAA